jgi:hypothetical protein
MSLYRNAITAIALFVATHAIVTAQENAPAGAPFKIKSGIVTWKISGKVLDNNTMTSTLTFDNFGLQQRIESKLESSPSGGKAVGREIVIISDSNQYVFHEGDTTGRLRVKMPLLLMLTVQETRSLINRFSFPMDHIQFIINDVPTRIDLIADDDLKYNGVKIKATKIAGRDAKLYEYTHGATSMKEALWNGIPLRLDATEEGKLLYSITATSVKENAHADAALFTVPSGIVFSEETAKH